MIKKEESLGIPNYGMQYLKMPPEHNTLEDIIKEFKGINKFINDVASSNTVPEFQGKKKRIQFINYGSTQLVYVLTIDEKKQYTFLVNQPITKFGLGKREFENLRILSQKNKENVITPLYYFSEKNRELYITPYHYQSRCIGVEDKEWGIWIPEPKYNFNEFKDKDKKIINASMVALLIKLYDKKEKRGLSEVRLDGGDFMLEKGFENEKIDFENIMKNIRLIAARNLENMELDEYIYRVREELSGKVTENKEMRIIGKKLRKRLEPDEIEEGIKLGLSLREKEKNNQQIR